MRPYKLPCVMVILSVIFSLGFALPASAKAIGGPETYTVMVGLENPHQGVGVMAYFPGTVTIHEGDSVHWIQNSNEIHTVTFLAGEALPELLLPSEFVPGADPLFSPLLFNPVVVDPAIPANGQYDGTIYANSGIMGREPGQAGELDLTFTEQGVFDYVCLVHGVAMSGEVVVVGGDGAIPSPNRSMAEGRKQMAEALSLVPGVVRDASNQVVPAQTNQDGSKTHTVMMGYGATVAASYGELEIDLMQFFPDKLTVLPGDNVTFVMSPNNIAPHTVTFLNGADEPPLAVFESGFLYVNPDVLFPAGSTNLTRSGVFSSGLLLPIPWTSYSFAVGDIGPGLLPFECLLHDTSGMDGALTVLPK